MKKQSLISAIIPTYNRADLTKRAIESVLAQTYSNFEIIVVDDNSTDQTQEIATRIQDPRIRYIRHSKNMGGAVSRNTGITEATGDFIAFLDSDDYWMPNKLEVQLEAIHQTSDPSIVVSYTQRLFEDPTYTSVIPTHAKLPHVSLADYLFYEKGDMQTSTLMLPRLLALKIQFRNDLKKHQDWDFCLRLEKSGVNFLFVCKPLTVWNNEPRKDQISNLSNYKLSADWLREYKKNISNKAITGFLFMEILPKLLEAKKEKWFAQKIIIDSFINQIIDFGELKYLTRENFNLGHTIRQVKRLVGRS